MTVNVEWMGERIVPAEAEFTLHGSYVDAFQDLAVEQLERTLTITLQPGQSWRRSVARQYRRGHPVVLFVNDERFVGRVKFRRLGKLVCVGRFMPNSHLRKRASVVTF